MLVEPVGGALTVENLSALVTAQREKRPVAYVADLEATDREVK